MTHRESLTLERQIAIVNERLTDFRARRESTIEDGYRVELNLRGAEALEDADQITTAQAQLGVVNTNLANLNRVIELHDTELTELTSTREGRRAAGKAGVSVPATVTPIARKHTT